MSQPSSSKLTFLDLPGEVRNMIYSLSLVSPSNIVVWSGSWTLTHRSKTTTTHQRIQDKHATISSIHHLALNLLHIGNAEIAQEAASIFYSRNTFAFLGDHNWDPIASWLRCIGLRNRSHITRLIASAKKPLQSWSSGEGKRLRVITSVRDALHRRNAHVYRALAENVSMERENIEPAIEQIFKLLGSDPWKQGGRKVKMHLLLDPKCLPGFKFLDEEEFERRRSPVFDMKLADFVDKYQALHNKGNVEVRWMGELPRCVFREKRSDIERKGWKVLDAREVEVVKPGLFGMNIVSSDPVVKICFTVKR